MKSATILAIAVLTVLSAKAQENSVNTDTVYYKYELIQTSEFTESGDTVYEVYFILKDEDLPKLNSILVLNEDKEKTISLSDKAISADPWFEKKANTLKIKIDNYPNLEHLLVTGLNEKSEQILLLDEEKKNTKSIKEIDTIIIPVKRPRPPKNKDKIASKS